MKYAVLTDLEGEVEIKDLINILKEKMEAGYTRCEVVPIQPQFNGKAMLSVFTVKK